MTEMSGLSVLETRISTSRLPARLILLRAGKEIVKDREAWHAVVHRVAKS